MRRPSSMTGRWRTRWSVISVMHSWAVTPGATQMMRARHDLVDRRVFRRAPLEDALPRVIAFGQDAAQLAAVHDEHRADIALGHQRERVEDGVVRAHGEDLGLVTEHLPHGGGHERFLQGTGRTPGAEQRTERPEPGTLRAAAARVTPAAAVKRPVYASRSPIDDVARGWCLFCPADTAEPAPGRVQALARNQPSRSAREILNDHARHWPVRSAAHAPAVRGAPAASKLGRLTLDKRFRGDLEATSKGQMLSAGTDVDGSAGYVAIEHVTGTLHGRSGAFALQHSGTMARGTPSLSVTVVPDSGTGPLRPADGPMAIIIADGKHAYALDYTLPS